MAKSLGDVTSQIVDLLGSFEEGDQRKILNAATVLLGHAAATSEHSPVLQQEKPASDRSREGTINVVTAKLGGDSCRKILMSAAAHLTLFQGRDKWSRTDWVKLASSARDWKTLYANGASRDISRLVKSGEIIENSADMYSLSSKSLDAVKSKL